MIEVRLPWPPSALRPNAASPGNWRKKQTAAKLYRSVCDITCREAGLGPCGMERAHLTITFNPPDNRRRDLDNMLASVKQGIDAVAQAIRLDDYYFNITIIRGHPVKGGSVAIAITEE